MEKKLRWGIMSTAAIAQRAMIPGIQESHTGVLQAIASRSLETAEEVAEKFSIASAYGSYEELLADEQIDAVYIPLPNHLHKEWVIKAARAGKHILCEKPIALTAAEAEEMKMVCEEQEVLLSEAFMYRYQPRYTEIKQRIKEGDIGVIRGLRGSFTFNSAGKTSSFRAKQDQGGGGLYDIGVYPVSAARMILDEEPKAATMHAYFSEKHDNVDMVAAGLLEFADGKFLTFDCGMWAAGRNELEIVGTDGRIVIEDAFTGFDQLYTMYRGSEKSVREIGNVNHYALQADTIARAAEKGENLPYDGTDAVLNMKVVDACLASARSKTRVEVV
ncbi:Gfo/Idh/MocA family protein [Alteribacillus sp. HJP-4]|uniref:Gfo/Idh/MocA family protein n=1 Tax=Alteribacillus sp. HJP-4 TaxID=2775394 RepID=UPI0035CD0C33